LKITDLAIGLVAALAAAGPGAARAAGNEVVIGDIDDLSGVYSDEGGTVLGRKIVTLVADHQSKPDIGASKFREWSDQNGLNMLLGGANTGVSIAMAKVVEANGGKNLGAVRVPLSAADFSSFLLQAQGSGAQVLGLANAGGGTAGLHP
jgi:hypothetical protein